MEIEHKKTFLIINPAELKKRLGNETLIVCGSARGMTSVVSFALYKLNYFIGAELEFGNFEDLQFQAQFKRKAPLLQERPKFLKLVADRNSEHKRWGFKVPAAMNFLDQVPNIFRNPITVLCLRNPVATAMSIGKRHANLKEDPQGLFRQSMRAMRALALLVRSPDVPSILINMEEAQTNPTIFLEELSELLGLEGDIKNIAAQISQRGYKSSEERPGVQIIKLS